VANTQTRWEEAFTGRGVDASIKMQGGTIFSDAASSYLHVNRQVGFTADKTIHSKIKFEREAMTNGVSLISYHADNGIYTSKEFMKQLANEEQGMKFSGVSAQFHNGVAENAIKIVTQKAHTMGCYTLPYTGRDTWTRIWGQWH
jgi:hydrogenase maturation factor HypF (carbamoyltransferase family)